MITPEEVRQFALSLPETDERVTWDEATFRVRDKIFVSLSPNASNAGIKARLEDQDMLIRLDPNTFAPSHYTGRFGWVTVQLATVDPDLMRDLMINAWRRTAPKRLVAAYDGQR